MLALYFLIDSLALALIAANIGLSGVLSPLSKADPFFANVLSYFGPFASFFVTGTIRIVIKKVNFNRWQNIIFKIVILADALCYFVLGFFLMYTNHKKTHGMLPKIDLLHKDFSLLFVFGGIAYYK
jgi:hypothetical protein